LQLLADFGQGQSVKKQAQCHAYLGSRGLLVFKGVLPAEFTLAGIAEILLYAILDTIADNIVGTAVFAFHIGCTAEVLKMGAFVRI
jgi:hypothetical protein